MSEGETTELEQEEVGSAVGSEELPIKSMGERPEWLPEKYETGEDLAKGYTELESKLGTRREKIAKEIEEARLSGRPESAGEYLLPDSIDESNSVDNDLLRWWSEHSYENGYGQEIFAAGIEQYRQALEATGPDIEREMERLGDNAPARAEAASVFASKFFPKETHSAIERLMETSEGVVVLEHIMENMKEPSFSDGGQTSGRISEDKLKAMMMDSRYTDAARRDPEFVKEIERGFQELYRS